MTDWYGKKPERALPITETWIRMCLKTGAITPPSGSVTGEERVRQITHTLWGVLLIVLLGAGFWIQALTR